MSPHPLAERSRTDRLKMEALSWGSTYRNFTSARAAIAFALMPPGSWPVTAVAYMVPWLNRGCPWTMEYVGAIGQSLPLISFWAFDHFCLFSWPLPLPNGINRATFIYGRPRARGTGQKRHNV
jgi:hypothetical protein